MISYAQNYEDVILHRCFAGRKDGFYIDVGAWDPTLDSVTKVFYDQGWSGINIEPNEFFFNKLMRERPRDINLKLAVGDREENRTLYVSEHVGNSTFVEAYRNLFVEQGFVEIERTVRTTTLASVCHDYVNCEIDFLKVDCEGWEEFALRGFDWERYRPIIVIVEATEPNSPVPSFSRWESILTDKGRYEMVYFDGLNRFYLRREYADLRSHFDLPPNVFDDFSTYAMEEARQKIDVLTAELAGVAEMPSRLEEMKTSNSQLIASVNVKAASLKQKEAELAAQAAENVRLTGLLDASNARGAELASQLEHDRNLEQELAKTRLWVGQLSQQLAAKR
jgi:FkbM family methyltransferase